MLAGFRVHIRDTEGREHRLVCDAPCPGDAIRRAVDRLTYRGLHVWAVLLYIQLET